jgi:uncharacterized protein (DUF433 family)
MLDSPEKNSCLDLIPRISPFAPDDKQLIISWANKHTLAQPGGKLSASKEPAMKSPHVISYPDILGGTPVFIGTRVPVRIIFEHLEAGDSLEVFLEDFPSVSRELAIQVLEDAKMALVLDAHPA